MRPTRGEARIKHGPDPDETGDYCPFNSGAFLLAPQV